MSNDATAYAYVNVGFAPEGVKDGVGYVYINVASSLGTGVTLGRVVGLLRPTLTPCGYTYLNVLQQIAGSTRTLEDGTTARHLEDGTTERTLE